MLVLVLVLIEVSLSLGDISCAVLVVDDDDVDVDVDVAAVNLLVTEFSLLFKLFVDEDCTATDDEVHILLGTVCYGMVW
jgi:hypothetical protein